MPPTICTIGHSIRSIDEFLDLLHAYGVQFLVDVRIIPGSRHNPQFNTEILAGSLSDRGITYQHTAHLGGLRNPRIDSLNQDWRNRIFRGYADYMQSEPFRKALDALTADSRKLRAVIMCAEAVLWSCHRSFIADALVNRECEVRHFMSGTKADLHRLTTFAIQDNGSIHYPDPDATLRMF
jgi:uncharacterized protein (DUF488 family)